MHPSPRFLAILCLAVPALAPALTAAAPMAHPLKLPYSGGQNWTLTRAYSTGTHIKNDTYALDFVEAGCTSWGKNIVAAAPGKVIIGSATDKGGYGIYVWIDHGGGHKTLYAHLASLLVTGGQYVLAGDPIGPIGNTGNVEGDVCSSHPGMHLHFAYRLNGQAAIPEPMSGLTSFTSGKKYLSNNKAPVSLTNGQIITRGMTPKEIDYHRVVVPSGTTQLKVEMSGLGDMDLYLRKDKAPTKSLFACRPYTPGSAEVCTVNNPASGTWYIMAHQYSASAMSTYYKVKVVLSQGAGTQTLSNGVYTSGAVTKGQERHYKITVPSGASALAVTMTGSGDADLYVKKGSAPGPGSYDCRPYLGGTNETCTIGGGGAGDYFIMVRGYASGSSSYNLKATTQAGGAGGFQALSVGSSVSGAILPGATKKYVLAVTAGQKYTVKMTPTSGDPDLYTHGSSAISTGSFSCRPYAPGAAVETCTVSPSSSGQLYVMVRGYSGPGLVAYTLKVTSP